MPSLRLLGSWAGYPAGRTVYVTRGEAELLIGRGMAQPIEPTEESIVQPTTESSDTPAPLDRADVLSAPITRAVPGARRGGSAPRAKRQK